MSGAAGQMPGCCHHVNAERWCQWIDSGVSRSPKAKSPWGKFRGCGLTFCFKVAPGSSFWPAYLFAMVCVPPLWSERRLGKPSSVAGQEGARETPSTMSAHRRPAFAPGRVDAALFFISSKALCPCNVSLSGLRSAGLVHSPNGGK